MRVSKKSQHTNSRQSPLDYELFFRPAHAQRSLVDRINPLVITDAGTLKPIAYDSDTRYDVGSINDLSSTTLGDYERRDLPALQSLIGGAVAGLQEARDLVDWFDHCTRLSEVA